MTDSDTESLIGAVEDFYTSDEAQYIDDETSIEAWTI